MSPPTSEPAPFSERDFYQREFRGRTLGVALPAGALAAPAAEALRELEAGGCRVVVLAPDPGTPELLDAKPVLEADDPRLEGGVWRALSRAPRVGVWAGDDAFAAACGAIALRLRLFKLVWLDPDGGLTLNGKRLSFVHLGQLGRLLASPDELDAPTRLPIWREIEGWIEAGVPAVNVCTPEGLAAELFSYAGSGTLFTREPYIDVRRLGVDDFDAAHDLIRRGEAEGYLAPRDSAETDRILASGFGAFVEGRDLAGIGALLPGGDGRSAEIACLYTLTRYLGEGVGATLVDRAVGVAREQGLALVFACTTSERVGAFFLRLGFAEVSPEKLPPEKWQGYDLERRGRLCCYRKDLEA